MFSRVEKASIPGEGDGAVDGWEVRPGGMLIQKRSPPTDVESLSNTKIRIRVKYGSLYHQILVDPRASFGVVKKLIEEKTNLHPDEQKILYKKKEKSSKMFLDIERVKEGSKLVVVQDLLSRDRRRLEMLKISNTQRALTSLSAISSQVDKLDQQVVGLEEKASGRGQKISEAEIENTTGSLLSELVKLDELNVSGDLNLQKINLEKRAQRSIERLDRLKLNTYRESKEDMRGGLRPILKQTKTAPETTQVRTVRKKNNNCNKSVSFNVSSRWETFD